MAVKCRARRGGRQSNGSRDRADSLRPPATAGLPRADSLSRLALAQEQAPAQEQASPDSPGPGVKRAADRPSRSRAGAPRAR